MEKTTPTTMSLCPDCVACPEVTVGPDSIKIGEAGNEVVLKTAEWNVLVDLIASGQLTRIA